MMVGHGLVGFAVAAAAARGLGRSREQALALGALAGAFAMVPDADMVYAPVGIARVDSWGVFAVTGAFWGASTEVHRTMTHSLLVAPVAAVAFAAWTADSRRVLARSLSAAVLTGLVVLAAVESGAIGGLVMAAFVIAGVVVGIGADRLADFDPPETLAAAGLGLFTHPFGDVFTGQPPEMLYPLGTDLIGTRVALSADPTLHLLAVFGLELATVWIAAGVYLWLSDLEAAPTAYVRPVAVVGAGYVVLAPVLRPPTLAVSYHFVFSVLGVGTVAAAYELDVGRLRALADRERVLAASTTGTAAVTLAWASYTLGYALGLPGIGGLAATLP